MKIDRISYQRVFSIGMYQNERIGMEASLDENENPEVAISLLRDKVNSLCSNPDYGRPEEKPYREQLEEQILDYSLRKLSDTPIIQEKKITPTASVIIEQIKAASDTTVLAA